MNKTANNTKPEMSWNPRNTYEKVNHTINEWPNWKKEAYNEMFAVSKHAKKVSINR